MKKQLFNSLEMAACASASVLLLITLVDLISGGIKTDGFIGIATVVSFWGSVSVFIFLVPLFLLYCKARRTSTFVLAGSIIFCLLCLGFKYGFPEIPFLVLLFSFSVILVGGAFGLLFLPKLFKENNPGMDAFLSRRFKIKR